ncbi:hypothetical protein K1W69_09470 [Hoeflea sp. WL0058]|uniref:Uncharacterized protein n=1 Tax=Flavimaribacter sediminis TaxID=2865987 RepID=A0AAE3D129_9HYPH|nr:hypothetical protein [Flavimaribacter sediminis]MBW8637416.1 hypothetical protein [Flavimaribacter sediminis]
MRVLRLLIIAPLVFTMGFWASVMPVGVKRWGTDARITCTQSSWGRTEQACRYEVIKICGPDVKILDITTTHRPPKWDEWYYATDQRIYTWTYELKNCPRNW